MICPPLVSNYSTPKVNWYQTDLKIIIRIKLIDVTDYYLRVEDDHLCFSTETNGKKYYLILYLFGPVISEKTVHKNVGREIKIYLTKTLKWFSWLRLINSKEKNLFISYDTDHIYDADNIRKKNNFKIEAENMEEYKHRNHILHIQPVVPSSDEEDSDEDQIDFFKYA